MALQHRLRYGYRWVTAELKRRGMQVNHRRVARIMGEDNLLAVQPKEVVTATESNDSLEVYLNLSRRMSLNSVDIRADRHFHHHGLSVLPLVARGRSHADNPVDQLTGWKFKDAQDKLLAKIFRIINQDTRRLCGFALSRQVVSLFGDIGKIWDVERLKRALDELSSRTVIFGATKSG